MPHASRQQFQCSTQTEASVGLPATVLSLSSAKAMADEEGVIQLSEETLKAIIDGVTAKLAADKGSQQNRGENSATSGRENSGVGGRLLRWLGNF